MLEPQFTSAIHCMKFSIFFAKEIKNIAGWLRNFSAETIEPQQGNAGWNSGPALRNPRLMTVGTLLPYLK